MCVFVKILQGSAKLCRLASSGELPRYMACVDAVGEGSPSTPGVFPGRRPSKQTRKGSHDEFRSPFLSTGCTAQLRAW